MAEPLLLTVEQSDGDSRTQPLTEGVYDIGRGADNAICIQDQGISRRHARILKHGDGYVVREDTASRNGTFVNGRRLDAGQDVALKDGDELRFGLVKTIFRWH